MSSAPTAAELIRAFNFRVGLFRSERTIKVNAVPTSAARSDDYLGDGSFQECTGLEVELDVQELQEGGRNDGVIRCIGRAKYQPLVLKRGMLSPAQSTPPNQVSPTVELWQWLQDVASGRNVRRYDGIVEVLDATGHKTVATWTFVRGLPAKVSGPQLNARTGEIAIEELHIAHEGLRLETQ